MKWWSAALGVAIAVGSLAAAAPPRKRSGKPDAGQPIPSSASRPPPTSSGVTQRKVKAFKFGTLEIKVQEGVQVLVDDRDLGKAPLVPIKLLEGTHRVRFVNPALGLDETQTVEIRAGQSSSLEVSFET